MYNIYYISQILYKSYILYCIYIIQIYYIYNIDCILYIYGVSADLTERVYIKMYLLTRLDCMLSWYVCTHGAIVT